VRAEGGCGARWDRIGEPLGAALAAPGALIDRRGNQGVGGPFAAVQLGGYVERDAR